MTQSVFPLEWLKIAEWYSLAGTFYTIPGEGNSNPLQYPCLQNPMDEEAW